MTKHTLTYIVITKASLKAFYFGPNENMGHARRKEQAICSLVQNNPDWICTWLRCCPNVNILRVFPSFVTF